MSEEKKSEVEKFLTLTLGDEFFALDIYSVREILDMTDITRIPQAPPFMRGVVNVRGAAVPVMDLKMKFGMPPIVPTLNTRIIILEINKGETTSAIGAMADSVKEVLELDASSIDPAPTMGASVKTDFIRGIGKQAGRFIIILDVDKVFSTDEIQSIQAMKSEFDDAEAMA
ncbi:chemotaxis protein CheW [Desulfovibrio inopinatus]|uniref:chemotaxis protein CheW n=1 Tax=Desulfovibrio inopinatus TaxID=102109 RepID=UPI0003F854C3|nr:chemotaxis protein CheW [Desulfovibrio inopinatus]